MHYGEFYGESIDKNIPAIVAKNPIFKHIIGTLEQASKWDFAKVCRKYNCSCELDGDEVFYLQLIFSK